MSFFGKLFHRKPKIRETTDAEKLWLLKNCDHTFIGEECLHCGAPLKTYKDFEKSQSPVGSMMPVVNVAQQPLAVQPVTTTEILDRVGLNAEDRQLLKSISSQLSSMSEQLRALELLPKMSARLEQLQPIVESPDVQVAIEQKVIHDKLKQARDSILKSQGKVNRQGKMLSIILAKQPTRTSDLEKELHGIIPRSSLYMELAQLLKEHKIEKNNDGAYSVTELGKDFSAITKPVFNEESDDSP